MQETQRAKTAFAEYLAMGPGRSLEKLLAEYKRRSQTGGKALVPTLRLPTLAEWSKQFSWQARVAEWEERLRQTLVANTEDAYEEARAKALERVEKALGVADAAIARGDFKADDAPAVDRLTKLQMQLLERPLVEKSEVAVSGELAVATTATPPIEGMTEEEVEQYADLCQRVRARRRAESAGPGEGADAG